MIQRWLLKLLHFLGLTNLTDEQVRGLCSVSMEGGAKPEAPRSPHWPAVEKEHLKKEPECQACNTRNNLQVHHVKPYHIHPELELEDANLLTLCEPHHLLMGHLMLWKSFNKDVRSDASLWRTKIGGRP